MEVVERGREERVEEKEAEGEDKSPLIKAMSAELRYRISISP